MADSALRDQLLDRRSRLVAVPDVAERADVQALLREVDSALERMDEGTYGLCSRCDGSVSSERLVIDPLARVCLDCLNEEETRALERDLQTASSVQAALLPAREVRHAGWEVRYSYHPHGTVSGDHCDVLHSSEPDSSLHVFLGDVSGKGVAASIVMANLHAVFRGLADSGLSLCDLVGRANYLFCESTLPNVYATLAAARLSPFGRLELVNAGHNPPLLVRDGKVTPLSRTGLPLGMFCGSEFEVKAFDLAPDDVLLLYTDGFSEARSPAGEPYGERRLADVVARLRGVRGEEVIRSCLDDLRTFQRDERPEDDLTLMVVRRLPR